MSELMCPLCEESLAEEGVHFYKHFKYKQYPCGDNNCNLEFYAEADRNAHCAKHGHKRSFQKTVNPYIDHLVAMIATDARELATKSMESVLESRFGADPDISIVSPSKPSAAVPSTSAPAKKRSLLDKTPVVLKKTKSTSSSKATSSGSRQSNSGNEETPRRPPKDTTSSTVAPEVHSTTTETPGTVEKQKRSKKKQLETSSSAADLGNKTYDEMSAIEKLIGWFDPNVPERKDAAKVQCEVCHRQIVYDYVFRKGHVTEHHMAADVAPEDYEDILMASMNKSFPDLPNSNLACQLCMTCVDIPRSRRREHIEKSHTTSLPPLQCPFDNCGKGFRRQCDLSGHMKDSHKSEMSRLKNAGFQKDRKARNAMINTLMDKCFPMYKVDELNKKIAKNVDPEPTSAERAQNPRPRTQSERVVQPLGDFSLDTDVRVLERSHNKTRRAPQYNNRDSSSDSSEDDDEDNNGGEATRSKSPTDYTQEIIFIGEQFNTEVAAKLSQRAVGIKREVVEEEPPVQQQQPPVVVNLRLDEPMDVVEPTPSTDEAVKAEFSDDDMKEDSQHTFEINIHPNAAAPLIPLMNISLPPPGLVANPQIDRSSSSPIPSITERLSRPHYRPDSIRPASRGGYDRHSGSSSSTSTYHEYNNNRPNWYQPPGPLSSSIASSSSRHHSYYPPNSSYSNSHSTRPFSREYNRSTHPRSRSRSRPGRSNMSSSRGYRRY